LDALNDEYKGGIFSEKCPVKYVITQKALAEGWDCAFAYVLVSMAGVKSATAVEQLLGRILRQPQAVKRESEPLNRSYAYVVSRDFGETAETLRDCLVQTSGFNRQEAAEFVSARNPQQEKLDFKRGAGRIQITPVEVTLSEELDVSGVSKETRHKLKWSKKTRTLTITAPISAAETEEVLRVALMEDSREAIARAGLASRTDAVKIFHTPSELGKAFFVPQRRTTSTVTASRFQTAKPSKASRCRIIRMCSYLVFSFLAQHRWICPATTTSGGSPTARLRQLTTRALIATATTTTRATCHRRSHTNQRPSTLGQLPHQNTAQTTLSKRRASRSICQKRVLDGSI